MWKNEECLIASFLQRISEEPEESITSSEESLEESKSGMILHREEAEAPKWLKTSTPEEIAVEILDLKKKEFPEEGQFDFHTISHYYWSGKGVESYLMPPQIQVKIQKAEFLAEKEMRREEETQRKERLAKEKEELPTLVSQCVDYARINGLKKLTRADVDTYILEKDLDILQETERAIYAMANFKLKTGK
jgi:hypothetical protein